MRFPENAAAFGLAILIASLVAGCGTTPDAAPSAPPPETATHGERAPDAAAPMPAAPPTADRIVVVKAARTMYLWRGDELLRHYPVALGFSPVGDKRREGDGRTPEGSYVIDFANPDSAFHLSLRISYPDADEHRRAAQLGIDPGGDIFIHGLGTGPRARARRGDWTDGCIAVSNAAIGEIYAMVPVGTPITILP